MVKYDPLRTITESEMHNKYKVKKTKPSLRALWAQLRVKVEKMDPGDRIEVPLPNAFKAMTLSTWSNRVKTACAPVFTEWEHLAADEEVAFIECIDENNNNRPVIIVARRESVLDVDDASDESAA